jgi:hypothetical protein
MGNVDLYSTLTILIPIAILIPVTTLILIKDDPPSLDRCRHSTFYNLDSVYYLGSPTSRLGPGSFLRAFPEATSASKRSASPRQPRNACP